MLDLCQLGCSQEKCDCYLTVDVTVNEIQCLFSGGDGAGTVLVVFMDAGSDQPLECGGNMEVFAAF